MAARWSDPQPPRPPLTAIRRGSTQLHINEEASGFINSVRISRSSRAAFGSGSAVAAAVAVATIAISTSSCSRASPRHDRDQMPEAGAPW